MNINYKKIVTSQVLIPISTLIVYCCILFLIYLQVLPPFSVMLDFLESLYFRFGYVGLFISAFLESIVYIGLYFPGSFIIVLSVLLSNGTIVEFLSISCVTALAITLANCINYYIGRKQLLKRFISVDTHKKKGAKSQQKHVHSWTEFLIMVSHPTLLTFHSFRQGIEKRSWKFLLYTFPILWAWGFSLCFIIFPLKDVFSVLIESVTSVIVLIILWICIATGVTMYQNREEIFK